MIDDGQSLELAACKGHYLQTYDDTLGNEDTPDEDDYILSDCGPLLSRTHVSQLNKVFTCETEAIQAIRDDMDAAQHWPNVWRVSDHGNICPVDLDN